MKIFITYASAGTGHLRAAEAIYRYISEKNKDAEVKLVDVLEYSNFFFKRIYSYGYNFLVHHCLWLWSIGFYVTCARVLYPLIKSYTTILNRINTRRATDLFIHEQPDIIISTHFLSSKIATYLKRKGKINAKLFTIITDFGVHPFWVCEGTDTYVVATSVTKEKLMARGVAEERIKELGIPVDGKFLNRFDKNKVRSNLGIEINKLTVLVVTGSFGIGPIEEIVDSLHKEVQVIAVCARNQELFKHLKKKNYPGVKVFGYVDNLHELMAAADIIITKPGGVTIAELLIMELVPIFISAITGQETANLIIMQDYGIGKRLKKINEVKGLVLDYKNSPDKLSQVKKKIREIKKPKALEDIFNVIC